MSGSTTLMQVSSSGAITTTGTISGGAAADALLLNGTGSLAFVTTASYNVASASFSSRTTQVERTYATTGSNTFTGAQFASDTSNAISFTSTASLYSDGGLRVQGNSFVSGTAYFNNIVVYGTSSIQYITSSQVNVGTNIITVNTDTPAVRFGGLAVFDSGSTGLTGSMLWDSEKNHWVYSNPSGSTYSGGMFISGPRSSALGSEQGTTACMLLVGQGSDHLTSSLVYHSSTCTNFYSNSLFVSSSGYIGMGTNSPNASLHINGTPGQNNPSIRLTDSAASGNGGNVYISADKSGVGYNNLTTIAFSHTFKGGASATNYLTIDSNGVSCFVSRVCAPTFLASNNIGINDTNPSAKLQISCTNTWGDQVNESINIVNSGANGNIFCQHNMGAITWYSTDVKTAAITAWRNVPGSGNFVDLAFATSTAGTQVERMRIMSGGSVGIGTSSPQSSLHICTINTTAALRLESACDQAGLRLIAGVPGTARASRIDFLNGATCIGRPQWTIINDYNQNGTNDLRFVSCDPITTLFSIAQNGVACFASNVCAANFSSPGFIRVHNTMRTFAISKNFGERESDANYFRISSSASNGYQVMVYSVAQNGSVGWVQSQLYQAATAPYWGGWVGTSGAISTIGSGAGYISSVVNGNDGTITFRVTTGNNGTVTTGTILSYIQVTAFNIDNISLTAL